MAASSSTALGERAPSVDTQRSPGGGPAAAVAPSSARASTATGGPHGAGATGQASGAASVGGGPDAAAAVGPAAMATDIPAARLDGATRPQGESTLPGVASQIVSVLSPLRTTPAGAQSVTILLHPAELGDVRATVTISADQVTVRLVATTSAGSDALRAALPELQSGLAHDGQSATVVLGDPGSGTSWSGSHDPHDASDAARSDSGGEPQPGGDRAAVPPPAGPAASHRAPSAHRLLDVRL
ncbi:MAG TPA: flagellar hook-length control protein FliK [Acidimicrobiales bacterium]|nr:flagellar hook-length control protein FliK [Acidimicrobiales bacterium]HVC24636.1 flagellar hook-length control protein FliK [Acidimicrobiales bacterium]